MKGKVVKGIGGFYYVHCDDSKLYECRAKGVFRKSKVKPVVGDVVEISILDRDKFLGNLDKIYPRKNELIRPMVSNIDQAVIVFSVKNPNPNFVLLDKFLVLMERKGIDVVIVFNKIDIEDRESVEELASMYRKVGYDVTTTSALESNGIDELKQYLIGKTSVFAGPSGVGKSSILNLIQSELDLLTGVVSEKIGRGKHTTRHTTLINFAKDSYVLDTPGFTSFSIDEVEAEELKDYFIDFNDFKDACKFKGCNHINEPVCAVKDAVDTGEVNSARYENYKSLFETLKDIRKKY